MIKQISENKTIAQICLVITTAIWGITFIIVKEALHDAPPYAFATGRFFIAAICNLFFIAHQCKSFTKLEILGGFLCGILLHFGYTFQYYGLLLTSASKSAFITGQSIMVDGGVSVVSQESLARKLTNLLHPNDTIKKIKRKVSLS